MKKLLLTLLLLSGCAGGHIDDKSSGCVAAIKGATTRSEIVVVLERMGVKADLADRAAVALMTSRLTPGQICASLKR